MTFVDVSDPGDPRLADYCDLTDVTLRWRHEPEAARDDLPDGFTEAFIDTAEARERLGLHAPIAIENATHDPFDPSTNLTAT